MRPLLALLVLALLGLDALACGSAGKGTSSALRGSPGSVAVGGSSSTVSGPTPASGGSLMGDEDDDDTTSNHTYSAEYDNDADFDDDRARQLGYRDSDDIEIVDYGRAASSAERQALTAVVERYYAAAAAADGRVACSLLALAFAKSIPEDYGRGGGSGPAYLRGKTCSAVMSLLFKHEHRQLSDKIEVTDVRIKGREALALLGTKTEHASYLILEHQRGGTWGIVGLLASVLP